MNRFARSSFAALVLATAGLLSASAAEPGFVDFGSFTPSAGGEFVEVNLQEGLIKFAARIAAKEEPAAAEVLRGLKRVRVNVIELDDTNRKSTTERVEKIRTELASQGWEQIVTVKGRSDENVVVFMKTSGEDVIEGIVVTVIEDDRKAVLVNVVGQIKADQLAELGERLDIEPLKGSKLALRR
ncbi:MAG TPA: DUF4252 domain-containing protein [Opitutaceae bacterium]